MPTDPATADAALARTRRWPERAVAAFPNPEAIYDANIATLRRLGPRGWAKVLAGEEAKSSVRAQPARAERRAAPKPARIPSGDRPMPSSDEGLS